MTVHSEEIQLEARSSAAAKKESDDTSVGGVPFDAFSLPPMDGGFDAWAFVATAWAMDFLLWAYPFSYGVFLNYYATQEFPHSSRTVLALVGSIASGILYLSSMALLPILRRYPGIKRKMMYGGLGLAVAGLIAAAFATEPWQLVLTQGVIYSTGASILYWPILTYLFEWFSVKKGLANGIIFSGAGVGGAVIPYIMQAILDRYSRKVTLIVLAGILLAVVGPAIPLAKARLPVSAIVKPKPMNTQFLRGHVFWILCISNFVQALGNFIPSLYIPTFAKDLGIERAGTLGVALLNASSAFGQIGVGYLSDRLDPRITISLCAIGSALSAALVWGLASTVAPIIVYSILFGLFSLSWASLWPKFASIVVGDDAATAMALFVSSRGFGNILAAPISEALLHLWAGSGKSNFAYGLDGYGPLILFTTSTQVASLFGAIYKYFERKEGPINSG